MWLQFGVDGDDRLVPIEDVRRGKTEVPVPRITWIDYVDWPIAFNTSLATNNDLPVTFLVFKSI